MTHHIIGSGDMLVPVAQIGYNGVSNKANGAGVQPPRAALSHHEGVTIVTTSRYYIHSTPQLNSTRLAACHA